MRAHGKWAHKLLRGARNRPGIGPIVLLPGTGSARQGRAAQDDPGQEAKVAVLCWTGAAEKMKRSADLPHPSLSHFHCSCNGEARMKDLVQLA